MRWLNRLWVVASILFVACSAVTCRSKTHRQSDDAIREQVFSSSKESIHVPVSPADYKLDVRAPESLFTLLMHYPELIERQLPQFELDIHYSYQWQQPAGIRLPLPIIPTDILERAPASLPVGSEQASSMAASLPASQESEPVKMLPYRLEHVIEWKQASLNDFSIIHHTGPAKIEWIFLDKESFVRFNLGDYRMRRYLFSQAQREKQQALIGVSELIQLFIRDLSLTSGRRMARKSTLQEYVLSAGSSGSQVLAKGQSQWQIEPHALHGRLHVDERTQIIYDADLSADILLQKPQILTKDPKSAQEQQKPLSTLNQIAVPEQGILVNVHLLWTLKSTDTHQPIRIHKPASFMKEETISRPPKNPLWFYDVKPTGRNGTNTKEEEEE